MEYEERRKSVLIEEMPDTVIEELFLQATQFCKEGSLLRKQWLIDKNKYSKESATTILDFEHFSLHDKTHSISILNSVGLLIGKEKLKLLNIGDLWLLLEVAYSHDLGMAVTYEELRVLWTQDNEFRQYFQDSLYSSNVEIKEKSEYIRQVDSLLLKRERFLSEETETIVFDSGWPVELRKYILLVAADYVRKHHAERSRRKIFEYANEEKEIESRLYGIVANIAYLHTQDFNEVFKILKPKETCFGEDHMHPRFVAVLLRLGDLLDMDNNRFDGEILRHFGELPHTSELHLKKHKALTHFDISPYQITAEASSDDIEVCIEIANWFHWLKEENYNFIAYWNQLAPKNLGGCSLSICDLKILYNGEEFHLSASDSYKIDKQHAIKLLIGDNIYDNNLDFLREYVQNAIDACKLQFEREYKEGELDYLLLEEVEDWNNCLPFIFKKEAFDKLLVKVKLQVIDRDYLEINIIDEGVGIEEIGLEALTTIGSGWKSRKYYQKQLKDLIFWLEPTAGFGIGTQSAFMISDQVEFHTKARMESKGNIIRLTNPRKSGSIIKYTSDKLSNGTEVKIKVPISTFMESELYRQKYNESVTNYIPQIVFKGEDYFVEDEIVNNIVWGMSSFLRNHVVNSLFPICIQNDYGSRAVIYSEFWFKEYEQGKYQFRKFHEYADGKAIYYYSIDEDFLSIYVIDCLERCLIRIEFAKESTGLFKYCYKGIAVTDEYDEQFFFNGMIDILGRDVKKYLNVNRKEFIKQFSKKEFMRGKIETVLRIYAENTPNFLADVNKISFFKGNQLTNLVYSFMKYLSKEKKATQLLQNLEKWVWQEAVAVKSIVWKDNRFSISSSTSVEDFHKMLFDVILRDEMLFVETNETAEFNIDMSEDVLLNRYDNEAISEDIYRIWVYLNEKRLFIIAKETERIELIEEILGEDSCVIGCGNLSLKVYGCGHKVYHYEKEEIDFERIAKAGKRTIIQNATKYEKLYVSEIPFTKREESLSKDINYLIMPMNALLISKIDQAISKKVKFDVFFKIIEDLNSVEYKEWHRLLDWVYQHQYEKMKYGKEELAEEYKHLLHDYYIYRKNL